MQRLRLFIILLYTLHLGALNYEVRFQGIYDEEALTLLEKTSQLVMLQNTPPETNAGLKRRAMGDIPRLAQALQSKAYYNPHIDVNIDYQASPVIVNFVIDLGPVYTIGKFDIVPQANKIISEPFAFDALTLDAVGITLDSPAYPKDILDSEDYLLEALECSGYPLARITKRDVVACQTSHTVTVRMYVDSGPLCRWGETKINGNCSVEQEFLEKKIAWRPGKVYDRDKIEKTQNALEASGLFSSITVTHSETPNEGNELDMAIDVEEGKHRSVGFGLSYTTHWGPGILAEWEHRNLCGKGEKLSLKANIWQRQQEGTLMYLIPDFLHRNQDLLWLAQLQREQTFAYTATSYSVSSLIQKQIHDHTRISYGLMYKYIHDSRTDNNREFNLIKVPLQLRWSNANSLLDPTRGFTTNLKITPTLQMMAPQFAYCINTCSLGTYMPLNEDQTVVLAGKANFGSIYGAPLHAIPPSERFYAGSENMLRGYRFMTVAPLRECGRKPLGGRSLLAYSLEMRFRSTDSLGWVLFYDFGNVYRSTLPQPFGKIRQSVGVGARYGTPVGPLRLDIGVPLNRRKHIDHTFEVYLSIGQAF